MALPLPGNSGAAPATAATGDHSSSTDNVAPVADAAAAPGPSHGHINGRDTSKRYAWTLRLRRAAAYASRCVTLSHYN